jgi:hypothetical protein
MRKWRLKNLIIASITLLILGASVGWVGWQFINQSPVTVKNFAKVQNDMTEEEVFQILGPPSQTYNSKRAKIEYVWFNDDYIIEVMIDENGRVIGKGHLDFSPRKSLLERLRQWFRL